MIVNVIKNEEKKDNSNENKRCDVDITSVVFPVFGLVRIWDVAVLDGDE